MASGSPPRFDGRRVACRRCGQVKTEHLTWLADNPHFTRRYAFHVGRLCREMPVMRVAGLLYLTWHQVKELMLPLASSRRLR